MRICFVGPASSAHIVKWCKWFATHGHEVHLISFTDEKVDYSIQHKLNISVDTQGSEWQKIKYLFTGNQIRRILREIKPDVVNAHYATSYGLAMALSGTKNYVLSVWGADVYDFPRKSPLHKVLLKYSLKKANYLFSTSQAMADETSKYTNKKFEITPFGVDMDLFNPNKRTRGNDQLFIVGTVKALSDKYGIRNILEAVACLYERGEHEIYIRIAGKGSQEQEYKQLAKDLGIDNITTWLGYISQEQAAIEWANMDIAIVPSTLESESFGVSAVEAQACGTPVIISNISGLKETTIPNKTSIVINKGDSEAIANAILLLKHDIKLRRELGVNGRKHVVETFSLDICFQKIEDLFQNIVNMES